MSTVIEYEINATAVENPCRWLTSEIDGAVGLPEQRGEDIVYPGVTGETGLPRVRGVAYDEFAVRVSGLNTDGTPAADPVAQHHQNMRDLRELLYDDSTLLSVEKTVHYPSAPVTYGPSDARCVGFTPRIEAPDSAVVLIRLKVYDGWGGVL